MNGESMRRLIVFLTVSVGVACARPPERQVVAAPAPEPQPVTEAPAAVRGPAVPVDDPVADEEALVALQELEFRSLAKGAEHVRGVLPAPDLAVFNRAASGARGGAASVGPTYDIDVESFADYGRVQYYIDYFLGPARNRFTIWLGRLKRYEGMIRIRFEALGVPEDMVYIGIIESGYSNTAVSRANAVGMWQFIRSTARLYGLAIDPWVDERRDPFKATDAAGRYLADLNAVFGSWYLAAAAYNGGEGRVLRGIRRLRNLADTLTDATFFDLSNRRYLRRETRDYVPKLIAAAIIAKDPGRYGFDTIPYLEPLVFDEITVPDATGMDVVARLADTTARTLMELNPQYVRGVTPPGRSSIVRVPRGTGPLVVQRYAELPPRERVNFVEHIVRRGETLSHIGRRYGVSVRLLRAANGNVHPRRLRIGQRLIIPLSPAARSRVAVGDAPRVSRGIPGVRFHVVRRGDTLWQLALRYGVTVGDLRRWNSIWGEQVLRIGQRLRVGTR
jgi:membrane-bound lytic murein transglycosylase D